MATPYSSINAIFLSKLTDYDFANMTDANLDAVLLQYLQSATVKFKHCINDLTMDNVNSQFDATLTIEEQEILASLMIIEWSSSKINDTILMKATLTDGDFQMFSQANQLKAIMSLRQMFRNEANQLIRDYTYNGSLTALVTTDIYPIVTDFGIGSNGGNGTTDEQV